MSRTHETGATLNETRRIAWMDGMERFFAMTDASVIAALEEIRIMRESVGSAREEILLVLRSAACEARARLCAAAHLAFPACPVRVLQRLN